MTTESQTIQAEQLINAGRKECQLQYINIDDNEIPVSLVPKGYELEIHSAEAEKLSDQPFKLKQRVQITNTESFIEYVKRHQTASTAIFCDVDEHKFIAVLDYHQGTSPSWNSHVAELLLIETPEWERWQAKDKDVMSQTDFALFVEDNMLEIINPAGAEMLEITKTLSSKQDVNFRSSIRLEDGQTQLQYDETIESKAGEKGNLVIPDKINLGITLYRGGDGYSMEARFRFRMRQGTLQLWYELIRPERAVADAVNNVFTQIQDELAEDNFAIYHGRSPV